jgi:hypothetical protein
MIRPSAPADGPVTLVEYGDYECHFPLTTVHPHAEELEEIR